MKDIKQLVSTLNLIYYEYDSRSHTMYVDTQSSQGNHALELVSLTHLLQKNGLSYFLDKEQNIVIGEKGPFLDAIKKSFKHLCRRLQNRGDNIYILNDKKVKGAQNLPIFETKPLHQKIDFSVYDAIVFTSKNAVISIDAIDPQWRVKPAYAIAAQTAKTIKRLGGQLRFVGKSHYTQTFAGELLKPLEGKKVLYLRASAVTCSLADILHSNQIACDEAVVYETRCKPLEEKLHLPQNAIIVFSSPFTVDCFMQYVHWDQSFQAIAIGETTAASFPSTITPLVAETTSLDSCVREAMRLARRQ